MRPRDVRRIAPRLRAIDRLEVAAFGRTPVQALEVGRVGSTWGATVVINGEPEAMLGVTPRDMSTGHGTPWFLGTDAISRQHRAWATRTPDVVAQMLSGYRMLTNHVACENVRARAWLRRAGFQFDAEPEERGGLLMIRFWMTRDV